MSREAFVEMAEKAFDEITYEGKTIREWVEIITKQQSCEDCISRESVRQLICKNNDKYGYSDRFHEFTEECLQLPSVTPQPKKGRWISHREHCENLGVMPNSLGAYYWCSNCDCGIDTREFHRNNYNYCPNCGAKMEVDE